jgi:lycopene beta-cyclase
MDAERVDVVIVGGGLAGCLTALRIVALQPNVALRLIESSATLGGNHTWSFFETDLTPDAHRWMDPLIAHRWAGYDVRFPKLTRTLQTGYRSVTSEHLANVAMATLGDRITRDARVARLGADFVELSGGASIAADCIIDARGARDMPHLALRFQKFVGHELETARPHGLERPIVMDATVAQTDGCRFVYTLPLSPTRLLIEDTYYSDRDDLPESDIGKRLATYAKTQGWEISRIVRTETGVLPIILAGDPAAEQARDPAAPPRIGVAGAFFHPVTGYSLPDAVRLAGLIAAMTPLTTASVRDTIDAHAASIWPRRAFFRLLNRMLFLAGKPDKRYTVLQHFYGLPTPLIQRFYAADLTAFDQARILFGKPPVPIGEALNCLSERAAFDRLRTAP